MFPPWKSKYTAQHILTSAVTPPTEISIPPVIITKLRPQDRIIRYAFAFMILNKVCVFKKPFPRKIIALRYITTNTTIVIVRSRLVSVILLVFSRRRFINFILVLLLCCLRAKLLANRCKLFSYNRCTEYNQKDNDNCLICRKCRRLYVHLIKSRSQELNYVCA